MRGKLKLGQLRQSIDLVLDLDDLLFYRGNRHKSALLQKTLGKLIALIAIVIISVFVIIIMTGSEVLFTSPYSIILSLSVFFVGYSLYLNRKMDKFGERLEGRSLINLKRLVDDNTIKTIEVENYFTDDVLNFIDEAYKSDPNDFLYKLSANLLDDSGIGKLLKSRLGITAKALSASLITEISNKKFEDTIGKLCINLFEIGLNSGTNMIGKEMMLIVLAKHFWRDTAVEYGLLIPQMNALSEWISNESYKKHYANRWKYLSKLKPSGSINRAYTSRVTHALNKYAKDYTSIIAKDDFILSIGKDEYLNLIIQNLRKSKDASILVQGKTGVGKTFLIKHLATRMVIEDVPIELRDHRLLVIDTNSLVATVSSDEELEQVFLKIFDEAHDSGNIILVFENFGSFISAMIDSNRRIVNIVTDLIRESKVKTICISASDDYFQAIKQNEGLGSLFEVVEVTEPSENVSFHILLDESKKLADEHKLEILLEAIQLVVELSGKIDHERSMPDRGINILEEVCIFAKAYGLKHIDKSLVEQFFSKKYKIKVGDVSNTEGESLINLEKEIHKRIIGQDSAVGSVAAAIRRIRSGISDENKPQASFLFYGPTGVGKTELAKVIADLYFGHKNKLIRFNMSEFHEDENLNRLIGYKDEFGKFNGGIMTEAVRQQPFSLILIDEIEKAHPKVLDLFLQILDEGTVTDGSGRTIDFKNTIIIATSNAASKEIANLIESGSPHRVIESRAWEFLQSAFRTEFLNRFDGIIMFKALGKIEMHKITEKMLRELNERLSEQAITISWDNETVKLLVDKGYNSILGAREMARTIKEEIENPVADRIVSKKISPGQTIYFKGLTISDIV